jgi:Alcohol dehydrogenase, class IV
MCDLAGGKDEKGYCRNQHGQLRLLYAGSRSWSVVYLKSQPANRTGRYFSYQAFSDGREAIEYLVMKATFDFQPRTRTIFGAGVVADLGGLSKSLGFKRTLLVADRGLVNSGHVAEALAPLQAAGIEVIHFHDFDVNPDTDD